MRGRRGVLAWVRGQPIWLLDGLLAVVLAGVHLWAVVAAAGDGSLLARLRGLDDLTLLVVALVNLPVAVRRRYPGTVLGVVGLSMVATAVLGMRSPGYGLLVALYSYAAWRTEDEALVTLAVFGFFAVLSLYVADAVRYVPLNLVIFISAWVLGDRQRAQRLRTAALERRAAALERERAAAAALATARERARIAREMHDVVAHGVMAMVTQAGAAERLIASDPGRAGVALAEAEGAGRASLAELRRLLGLLRGEDDPALDPQPRLEDVERLVESFADLGLNVSVAVAGPLERVPTSLSISAFRILQEGLTNVLLHADARRVEVRVAVSADRVEVAVLDDGRGPLPHRDDQSGGTGLIGLRERVALLGGRLSFGPRPISGHVLEASLPIGGAA